MSTVEARRTLILILISHSLEDMGTLGKRLPANEEYRQLALERWIEIQQQVQRLQLDWSKVKVYQDGLPDVGPEMIQKILAEVKSPNYDLLRWLVSQGADLVGTESPALIKEEYEHLRAVLTAKGAAAKGRARKAYAERAADLLAERDAYVAQRIAETLPPSSVGILFFGQAHRVCERLAESIDVLELDRAGSAC